ncbi:MAG: hypothetical protein R6X18_01975 [Chloroflexota bacterium]
MNRDGLHFFETGRLLPVGTLLLLFLLLSACNGSTVDRLENLLPVIGSDQSAPVSTTPLSDFYPSPAVDGAETPVLMCTPPACGPGEVFACPTGDCPGGCGTVCAAPTVVSGPLPPSPTDWESLEGWLTALWRGGANPAAVRAALQASGMQKSDEDWRAADFDGDLQDEWILVLYDPSMPATPWAAAGDLWIVNGDGPLFRYFVAPSSDIYSFLAPKIIGVVDLTGDGRPELIAETQSCGAHTCFGMYRIINHSLEGFRDLVYMPGEEGTSGQTITMSSPEVHLQDVDGDDLPEFLVHGGAIGSVGAGIMRTYTEVWDWDGTAVILAEVWADPTDYRHHILYEANDLMAKGDLEEALLHYEAAINDGTLRNDGFFHSPEATYQSISQFAAFRLILIDLLRGAPIRASERLAWLQATYSDTGATQAAALLTSNWTGPENLGSVCAMIEGSLAARENPTGALADMGYGNPNLTAADYCP